MGWSNGVDLFDGAVEAVLDFAPKVPAHLSENRYNVPEIIVQAAVERVYKIFEHSDWDTQDESKFYVPYLAKVLLDRGDLDEEEYEEILENGY